MYKYEGRNPLYNGTQNYPVPDDYQKPFYLINPAAMGIWYGIQTAEEWQTQIGALYSVTIDGLGKSLIEGIAFNLMVDENFATAASVKSSLWPTSDDVSVDVNKTELIRTDKTYGLNK